MNPERIGPTDDGRWSAAARNSGRRRSPDSRFIRKTSSGGDEAAALPDRQRAPETIPAERIADREAIDDDRPLDAADGLTRKSEDVLQERHAFAADSGADRERSRAVRAA